MTYKPTVILAILLISLIVGGEHLTSIKTDIPLPDARDKLSILKTVIDQNNKPQPITAHQNAEVIAPKEEEYIAPVTPEPEKQEEIKQPEIQCQYPDRVSNPPNGCDNSDPACGEVAKGATKCESDN